MSSSTISANTLIWTLDWKGLYIPNDLNKRGFLIDKLDADSSTRVIYARNKLLVWNELCSFVSKVLHAVYADDSKAAVDQSIQDWASEIQSPVGGQMEKFPSLKTIDDFIDAVTMCIHIASPQHTAVDYLQDLHLEFVINKSPGLCTAPPTSIDVLKAYGQEQLYEATPAKRVSDWLLASHLSYLLSMKVAEEQNLTNYAKCVFIAVNPEHKKLKEAAGILYTKLKENGFLTNKFI